MQPVVVRGFAELRDAGITRTGYELYGLLLMMCLPFGTNSIKFTAETSTDRVAFLDTTVILEYVSVHSY